jgi:hypothetical protein
MSNFSGFNQKTRLYAKYENVVQEMQLEFKENVGEFLDAVRDRVSEIVSGSLKEKNTASYRYGWLAGDYSDKDKNPQLWGGQQCHFRCAPWTTAPRRDCPTCQPR